MDLLEPHRHYTTDGEKRADLIIHVSGLAFATLAGSVLLALALDLRTAVAWPVLVYVAGLNAMLVLSCAYNFASESWRPLMRRLDHAGIFFMIAASYTPFTTTRLPHAWGIWMTLAVWLLAGLGMAGKLFLPGVGRRFWIGLYLALGWMALIAIRPLIGTVPASALALIGAGGLIYSVGAGFYAARRLKYRRAIWHGHVLGGSVLFYVAVLLGVVLAPSV